MGKSDITEPIEMFSLLDKFRIQNLERKQITINWDSKEWLIKQSNKEIYRIEEDSIFIVEFYSSTQIDNSDFPIRVISTKEDSFLIIKNHKSFFALKDESIFWKEVNRYLAEDDLTLFDELQDKYGYDSSNIFIFSLLHIEGNLVIKKEWKMDMFDLHRRIKEYFYLKEKQGNPHLFNGCIDYYIKNEAYHMTQ